MSIRFDQLASGVARAWDGLVHGSPDGWAFSLTAWQRLVLGVREWRLRDHSFATYENGQLVAVMPLQWNAASRVTASTGWGGSGPVIAEALGTRDRERIMAATIEHALSIAIENGSLRLDLALSPVTRSALAARWGVNPFVFHGFHDTSQITQVINLTPLESDLAVGLTADARRLMRRATGSGLEVRQVSWPDYLDAYYDVHCETYQRTGVMPHPRGYFEGIAREMAPDGHALLFAGFTPANEPIAFVNLACFGPGAMYHTGCSRHQALAVGANYLVLWQAVLAAKRAGRLWFEMGPVFPNPQQSKQEGLTRYKMKFGGEPHRFFRGEMPLPSRSDLDNQVCIAVSAAGESEVKKQFQKGESRARRFIGRLLGWPMKAWSGEPEGLH